MLIKRRGWGGARSLLEQPNLRIAALKRASRKKALRGLTNFMAQALEPLPVVCNRLSGHADVHCGWRSGSIRLLPEFAGVKMGGKMVDTMLKDGLTDAFNSYHMGVRRKCC